MLDQMVWFMAAGTLVTVVLTRAYQWRDIRSFTLVITFGAITEFLAFWALNANGANILVYNIYMPVEYTLLMWYAGGQIRGQARHFWPIAVLAYVALWSFDVALMNDPDQTMASNAFTMAILTLGPLYFYLLYSEAERTSIALLRSPHFWANFSIVIYFTTMGPAMGLFRYLVQESSPLADRISFIFPIMASVRYGLSMAALIIRKNGKP